MPFRTVMLWLPWLLFVGSNHRVIARAESTEDGWVNLLNGKNLEGWYTFLDKYGRDSDPEQVFTVEDDVVHIYKHAADGADVPLGFFSTPTEYAHYHLQFQYKWGSKRFGIRTNEKRDSGVMYHCVGPDGVLGKTWPRCLECQVQEGDTGDALCLAGARFATWVNPHILDLPGNVERQYLAPDEGGEPFTASVWTARSAPRDELEGWNTVDVLVFGNDYAVHSVNGAANNRLYRIEQTGDDGQWRPLGGGRILFQAELAEVFYRNIKIRPLPTGPLRPKGSALTADAGGVFCLAARDASLDGPSLRFQPDENSTLGHWHALEDLATWTIDVARAGTYDFELEWAIDDAAAVNTFRVTAGGSLLEAAVAGTGGWWTYHKKILGELQLEAGVQQVTIQPIGAFRGALMDLRAIRLVPRN